MLWNSSLVVIDRNRFVSFPRFTGTNRVPSFRFRRLRALGFALVVQLFAARQRQLAFDPALLQIYLGRHQRQTLFASLALQFLYLVAVQQQLADTDRLVIGAIPVRILSLPFL
jgi:hypothetical protein